MDDQTFNQLLGASEQGQQAGPAPRANPSPLDDNTFNQLLGPDQQTPATPPVGVPAPGAGEGPVLPPVGSPEAFNPQGGQPGANEPGLSDPTKTMLDAPVAGAAESIFQTKDFLTGETPEDQKSQLRKNAEHDGDGEGAPYALTKGVAQFATGLLGAGKLVSAAEGVSALGTGIAALKGLRGGTAALESAKAAAVGAIAFDPHTERLSNLIQASPALSNPVNQFLAAKPDDSAAAGRFKNAMESLGMDAALIGVIGGSVKAYRAISDLKGGTGGTEAVVKASDELNGAMDAHNDIKARQDGSAAASAQSMPEAPKDAEGAPVEMPGVPLKQFSEDSTGHVVAYHGSPHDFSNFDVSKIGTGEGAQAFGHGLYFAESKDVAQTYKDMFAGGDPASVARTFLEKYEGSEYGEPRDLAAQDLEGAVSELGHHMSPSQKEAFTKAADLLRSGEEIKPQAGALYQVRIARPQDHFLDWDREFKDQSPYVQERLKSLGIDHSHWKPEYAPPPAKQGAFPLPPRQLNKTPDGRQMLSDLRDKQFSEDATPVQRAEGHLEADAEATRQLHASGIAGVKYLDGGSRGAGDGTRNYVVFHHDDVAITHKNGEVHTDLSGREFTKETPEQPWKASAEPITSPDLAPSEAKAQIDDRKGAGEDGLPARPKLMPVSPEEARSIYEGTASDIEAFQRFGSWDDAVDNGHIFGKGGSIPYQKLVSGGGGRTGLDAFITNTAEQLKDSLDAAKGGAVLSDARVAALVQQRYALYGEDPAALMGVIQRAGQDANSLVANMEASYGVAQRGYQDAFALAARIKAGDLSGFGGMEEAMEGLRSRIEVASSAWASGQAMRSASGRALRRMRSEFRLEQADVDALKGMDGDALVALLNSTEGDPRALKVATHPGLLRQVTDAAHFLYTNNLLWGLRTHFINFSTNLYMVATRPTERILGSLAQSFVAAKTGNQELAQVALDTRRQALRSYTYMGASLHESWRSALQTFDHGDSIMAPHGDELGAGGGHNLGQRVAQLPWRPWDSLGNVTANALMVAAPKALGLPSRTIGMVDEFIKGISYRSNVQAAAHMEGIGNGLTGDGLTNFVRNRLYDAFDDSGRAVNEAALQEAKIATYQQDLLPGTIGAGLQGLTANNTWLRFIVPFVKTPTNVLRMGVKLTPGLNMLQGEYRAMIRGERGPEQQAQAIGQMAMGSLFMGLAAYLHHSGAITGGGPSNPKLKADLRATGWQPYSFVKANADGSKTYIPYGRFDPVAMPFGMVADISDVLHADPDSKAVQKAGNMMLAVGMSLAKSFSEKTYMKSVDDALKFALDPEHDAAKFAGQTTANFIPAASLLRLGNPDPYLRDARSYLDHVKASIPGFSETLPAKRDAFGDPLTVHKGLWVNAPGDIVDSELRRMADQPFGAGNSVGPPSATYRGGIDLRDVRPRTAKTPTMCSRTRPGNRPRPRLPSSPWWAGSWARMPTRTRRMAMPRRRAPSSPSSPSPWPATGRPPRGRCWRTRTCGTRPTPSRRRRLRPTPTVPATRTRRRPTRNRAPWAS